MTTGTPSQRLRVKVALAAPVLRQRSESIWCSPRVRELYPLYLATMHGIVRSAGPLLNAAAERARELAPHDEVAAPLIAYYTRHALEEAGHEKWLQDDLEAIGAGAGSSIRPFPGPKVATFVGAQYYWLRHAHPVALLGHMAVVEGHAPQPGLAERLEKVTGYPPDGFRTIRRHARIDVGHVGELYRVIDSLPLRHEHESLLGISALHTIQSALDVLDDLTATVSAQKVEAG